jgi:two-component system sensor histidine kinase KdpD
MGLFPAEGEEHPRPDRLQLIAALASQTALVLERTRLAREAQDAAFRAESERLKDSLLRSVSHDLRTPLGTITGGASSLADPNSTLSEDARRELAKSIWIEAERLNRLVSNLLNMSRLESGAMRVQKEWHPIDEVVGAALNRLDRVLRDRPVEIEIPLELPLVPIDDVLIEQVLVNLIENAVKFAPDRSPIEIRARAEKGEMVVSVADRGPGVPPGWEERIFARFQDSGGELPLQERRGAGLGLAICKGFVEAHGGRIRVANRSDGGGAVFVFFLPLGEGPPSMPAAEEPTG